MLNKGHRSVGLRGLPSLIGTMSVAIILGFAPPAVTVASAQVSGPPAPASPAKEIHPGETVTSAIPVVTATSGAQEYEDFRLHLEQNQSIRIDMDSPAPSRLRAVREGFDTFLELRRPGVDSPVATNDDRPGGNLNSRIVFTAPAAGDYIVRARPLGGIQDTQSRTYVLNVIALPPAPPPTALAIGRVEGELGANSPISENGSGLARYALYSFPGAARERVQLDMASSIDGPGLQLVNDAGRVVATAFNASGDHVRLIAVLPAAGMYQLRAQLAGEQPGHFTLDFLRAADVAFERAEALEPGQTAAGALSLRSNITSRSRPPLQADFFYKLYSLPVREGETVVVTLTATGFDPILEAGLATVLGFSPMLANDDRRSGEVRLVIQPLQTGTAMLRVSARRLEIGNFTLRVSRDTAAAAQ